MIDIKVVFCHENAKLPVFASELSAGSDLHAVEDTVVKPGETVKVRTGLKMEIPMGYELQIRPRSGLSLNTKVRVANSPGTIDADFRGEIEIILENTGKYVHHIKAGDRVAQGVLSEVPIANYIVVQAEELTETSRGAGGFGKSGTQEINNYRGCPNEK